MTRQTGCIRIRATDNVQVTEVRVTISDDKGNTQERGLAASVNDTWREYATSIEGRVRVEAFDPAGNVARYES